MKDTNLTSREIMAELGIKSVKTLTRWHQLGLIPAPEIDVHPDGSGRVGTWPSWVLRHCRKVMELREKGATLKQIVASYGDDWEEIAKEYAPRKLTQKPVGEKMLEHELGAAIELHFLKALGVTKEQLNTSSILSMPPELARQALKLYREGYSPVLLHADNAVRVIADVSLSHVFECGGMGNSACVAFSVAGLVEQAEQAQGHTRKRRIFPAKKVEIVEAGRKREVGIDVNNNLKCQLVSA